MAKLMLKNPMGGQADGCDHWKWPLTSAEQTSIYSRLFHRVQFPEGEVVADMSLAISRALPRGRSCR